MIFPLILASSALYFISKSSQDEPSASDAKEIKKSDGHGKIVSSLTAGKFKKSFFGLDEIPCEVIINKFEDGHIVLSGRYWDITKPPGSANQYVEIMGPFERRLGQNELQAARSAVLESIQFDWDKYGFEYDFEITYTDFEDLMSWGPDESILVEWFDVCPLVVDVPKEWQNIEFQPIENVFNPYSDSPFESKWISLPRGAALAVNFGKPALSEAESKEVWELFLVKRSRGTGEELEKRLTATWQIDQSKWPSDDLFF